MGACGGPAEGDPREASPTPGQPRALVPTAPPPTGTTAAPPIVANRAQSAPTPGPIRTAAPQEPVPPALTVGDACAGESVATERLPLDMYFLVDTSGSMAQQAGSGTRWQLVRGALLSFLQDPANSDVGVGIGYFPEQVPTSCTAGDPNCTCIPFVDICYPTGGGTCDAADYAQPAVPLSLAPQHATIESDLVSRDSNLGGTPTLPAVQGAMQHLEKWATNNPGRRVVLVLATDGEPTGCRDNSPEAVAEVAGDALSGPNSIQTFVIGVGGALGSLNRVAKAGGTTQAFLTDANSSLAAAFADALSRIRTQALPCEYVIPASSNRGAVDPFQVNVVLSNASSAEPGVLPRVAGDTSCGNGPGWYYNDPAAPTSVRLCEASCQASTQSRIELLFGCETVTDPLR